MRFSFALLLLSLIIAPTVPSLAQVPTGTPPFGSFGGGPFDTVNLGNLNVHFAVPVVHKAGRGMPFTYDLSYDSSVWTAVISGGVTQWQPVYNWGWKGQTEVATGYISFLQLNGTCRTGIQVTGTWNSISNHVYHDAFGTSHAFPYSAIKWIRTGTCGSSSPASGVSTDGTGFTLNDPVVGPATITDRSGRLITPPYGVGSGAGTATDANGNQITVNSSGQFFDTLSSTTPALTVSSAAPPTPTTFTYTSPAGSQTYTMNYEQYTVATDFASSGIEEYPPTSVSLVSGIKLPDGSGFTFAYEATSGACTPLTGTYSNNCVTGRINSVTLPTGGTIAYIFRGGSGGNNYINPDGTTGALTRTLSPGGQWLYDRDPNPFYTKVTDPGGNQTVIYFAEDSNSSNPTYNFYETQRQVYQGPATGTPLSTTITCYNGNSISSPSNCYKTAVSNPILRTTVFKYLPNSSGLQAETDTTIDQFGLTHEVDEFDYGVGKLGPLIRKTISAYAALGNGIVDRPSSVTIEDGNNNIKAYTSYGYDATAPTGTSGTPQHISITGSRGLLTSVAAQVNGTTNLYRKYTYYDTGTLSTSTDVSTSSTTNGALTTYNYSSAGNADCGNAFVTSITEPLSLSRSMTWNCNGGVMLSLTDENGKTSSTAYSGSNYTNYFWRPYSTTDQTGNVTDYFYYLNSSHQPFQTESKSATFNNGNSIVDVLTTSDGFGRSIFNQTKQGPNATTFDTVATCYDSSGRVSLTTMPYSATAIPSGAACPSGNAGNSYSYDALNRTTSITNTGGGATGFTYNENDVLQTVSSPAQKKQQEYDALGRLTSVCEVTAGTTTWPGASCSPQNAPATGYLTKYAYDAVDNRTSVTQNAQASTTQTRTYVYDELGHLTSELNPESGTTTYVYDSLAAGTHGSCSAGALSFPGQLMLTTVANGDTDCYLYDALRRVTDENGEYSGQELCRRFRYDNTQGILGSIPPGVSLSNTLGRLAEAETDTCAWPTIQMITDEWFSYDADGRQTDTWEQTPNSGGYYHSTASYWPNSAQATLGLFNSAGASLMPTQTYGLEGEGRPSSVTASSGQNPVSSVTYATSGTTQPIGSLTQVTFGSADSDTFQYDTNTGRMKQYSFNVNGQSAVGNLTWNTNGSLQQLAITDPFNSQDNQTCTYSHDDIDRLSGANCGSTWTQTFSYDPFGNISKSGSISWQPNYNPPNNQYQSGWNGVSYDASGNLLNDTFNSYTWNAYANMTSVNGAAVIYDALGRMVENNHVTVNQFVYAPGGQNPMAAMQGQTLITALVPLPGGAVAAYNGAGLVQYNHPDWLGSVRLFSTPSRGTIPAMAYAPFGEGYAGGANWIQFTGVNSWTVNYNESQSGTLDDFLFRRYSPVQGRWISPDPAGTAAANPSDPQSWNRYAYVGNRPLMNVDPLGTDITGPCDPIFGCGPGGPGGGYCPPEFQNCNPGCDPVFGCGGPGGPGGPGGGGPPGGGPPNPPQRQGGKWTGNETLGLPQGLNTSPMSLDDLILLSPGTQFGSDFTRVAGIDDAIEIGLVIRVVVWAAAIAAEGYAVYKAGQYGATLGDKAREQNTIADIARRQCVDRYALGDAIEEYKRERGMPNNANLDRETIKRIAKELYQDSPKSRTPNCVPQP